MRMPRGAQAHGGLHGPLQGAAEGNPAHQLLCDIFRNQLRLDFRLADLNDIQVNLATGQRRDFLAQFFDIRAFPADHNAGTGGVNGDPGMLCRTLDQNLRHACLIQLVEQDFANLQILVQQIGIFRICIPARIPGPVNTDAEADWIDLMTHYSVSSRSRTTTVRLLKGLRMLAPRPRARARNLFIIKVLPTTTSFTYNRSTSS